MTNPQAPKHTALLPVRRTLRVTLDIDLRPFDEAELADCDGMYGDLDGDFDTDDASEWSASEIADLISDYISTTEDDEMFAGTGLYVKVVETTVVEHRWTDEAPLSAIEPDPSSSAQKEAKALREYAFELTKAFTSLTAGGSEYFGRRIGDMYTADIPFCLERIRESKANLFSEMKDARRQAAREASSAQEVRAALGAALRFIRNTDDESGFGTQRMDSDAFYLKAFLLADRIEAALASAPPVRSQKAGSINAEARFLIRKGGAYYRPNSEGYTTSVVEAGRYTLAEAEDITHPNGPDGPRDGMSYIEAPAPPVRSQEDGE